jgi:hypothetical protein
MKRPVRCLILSLSIVLLTLGFQPSLAQSERTIYFPQTGHRLSGEFLAAYESVRDPGKLYGFPITDAFTDPVSGSLVQYFERARFVLDPQAPAQLRVRLTPLGELLYEQGADLPHAASFPACRSFPETGFEVCYAFLDFFKENGDVPQFGYPISNFEIQDGLIVQYFQRSRFEWHPELPAGQRVTLGNLGIEYFKFAGEDPLRLLPDSRDHLPQTVFDLQVRASTALAVIPRQSVQTLYVTVQDQNLRPVPNVPVRFTVKLPSGEEAVYTMVSTDKNGISTAEFKVEASSTGIAEVRVTAQFDTILEETLTSFRIWW